MVNSGMAKTRTGQILKPGKTGEMKMLDGVFHLEHLTSFDPTRFCRETTRSKAPERHHNHIGNIAFLREQRLVRQDVGPQDLDSHEVCFESAICHLIVRCDEKEQFCNYVFFSINCFELLLLRILTTAPLVHE